MAITQITAQIGKLDESIAPESNEAALVRCENVDYSKPPRLSKRTGMSSEVTLANAPARLIAHDKTILVAPDLVSNLEEYRPGLGTVQTIAGNAPFARVRRKQIFQDLVADTALHHSCAYSSSGYFIHAYQAADRNGTSGGPLYYRVEDTNGTNIISGTLNFANLTINATASIQVVASNDGSEALIMWVDAVTGFIRFQSISLTSGPVLGSAYNMSLATPWAWNLNLQPANAAIQAQIGSKYLVGFHDTNDDFFVWGLTSANTTVPIVTNNTAIFRRIAIRAANDGTAKIWIGVHDDTNNLVLYALYDVATAAYTVALTTVQAATAAVLVDHTFSICPGNGNATISWTQDETGDLYSLRWATVNALGSVGTIGVALRLEAVGEMCYLGGQYIQLVSSKTTTYLANTYSLFVVALPTQSLLVAWAPVLLAAVARDVSTVRRYSSVSVSTDGARNAYWSIGASRRGEFMRPGIERLTLSLDNRRFQSVKYGELTYIASGVLWETDGYFQAENNFAMMPEIRVVSSSTGTGIPAGTYQYACVYEYVDRFGHWHQGTPQFSSQIVLAAPFDIVLELRPCVLSYRQPGTTSTTAVTAQGDQRSRVITMALYRRKVDGDGIYYRVTKPDSASLPAALLNAPVATTLTSFTDNNAAPMWQAANGILYITGDRLEEDHIAGGATCITVHKNRLFTGGGEFGFEVYYSQEIEDGKPAMFNLAQKIEVPGLDVRMLASLDDALVVGDERGLFAIFGEGPNRTGNTQSGSYTLPVAIRSETGVYSNVRLEHQLGVWFVGRRGIYLLDRSRQVRFMGLQIEDTFAAWPNVAAIEHHEVKNQVWVLLHDSAILDGVVSHRIAVYDVQTDSWSIHKHGANVGIIRDLKFINGSMYFLNATTILKENTLYSDNGSLYTMNLETGQIGFGDPLSAKRLKRIAVQGRRVAAPGTSDGMSLLVKVFGGARTGASTISYTLTEASFDTAGALTPWVTPRAQQGARFQVSLEEHTPITVAGAYDVTALGFEVESDSKLDRVPASRST